jgi:hypothetical protein
MAASAQVYQWKDKNGRTIISDSPPPSGIKSRVLAPEASDAAAPQKSLADQEAEFRKRQQEAQARSDQDAKEKAANAQRKEYCDDARRQLALLKSGERIVTREISGERSFMDDEKRAQETATMQRLLDENCKGF